MDDNSTSLLDNTNRPSLLQRIRAIFKRKEQAESDNEELKPVSFFQLFRFASRSDLFLYSIALSFNFILGLILPSYIYLYSRVTASYIEEKSPVGNEEFLFKVWKLCGFYAVVFVVSFTMEYTQHYILNLTSERIAMRCRSEFVAAILARNSMEFTESSGELGSQLNNHIDRMKEGLGDKVGMFVRCTATFFTCCIVSFLLDWQTSLFLLWAGPVYIVTAAIIPKISEKATKETLKVTEEANGISEESLVNVKTIQSCNGQKEMLEKYSSILQSGVRPSVRVAFSSGLLDASANLTYFAFNSLGLWWATISYHNGRVASVGDVFAVVFIALNTSNAVSRLGPHVISLMKSRIAAAKIYQTIDSVRLSKEKDEDIALPLDPTRTDLHIEFKNISYSFTSRPQPVLQSISFDLKPGTSIGLVGKSGCGKSTTLKLLTRFLDTDFGQILLDGIPIERYDKKKWRQMIGVVSQEPCLFSGSIRENICLGRPFSDEEVEEACKIAYAHEFIVHLDKGYDTMLGSSGISLSGGQKQRIGIARAIVSNPRLLLLDEATSALDSKSERIVQEALDNASEGRSSIVIAHRLSTIKNVDEVIVMENGEIVERGGYHELRTKSNGIFSRMVTEQEIERRKSRESRDLSIDSEESDLDEVDVDDTEKEMITEQISEESFPSMKGGLIALLTRHKWKTAVIFLLGFFRGFSTPILALRYFFVFGSLEDEHYETILFWLMVGTMAVGVYNFFMQLISQPISQYIGETVMNDLRVSSLSSLLHRPISYFDRSSTSPSASSVLLSQQPALAMSMIDNKLVVVISGIISWTAILSLAFISMLPLGGLGLFYLVTYFLILIFFEKFTSRANQDLVEADKSGEMAVEIFDNIATIQQLAVEDHFQWKYDEIMKKREGPLRRKVKCESVVHGTNESIFYLVDFLAAFIGVYFVYLGFYTAKMLFLAENLLSTAGWLTFQMSISLKDMISSSSAAKLLFALIDPTLGNEDTGNEVPIDGSLNGDSLSFAYPSRPDRRVLSDVSFTVPKGRSIAFVGPSGGGKSTIINLLERFYDPLSGRLLLDDSPFTSFTKFQLRSSISLVSQEPILFRGTIRENICLGVEGITFDQMKEACRISNAIEFIETLPEGYETLVGEKGRSLSGGQKQRIAIARALVRNPKVIILDEATSALDTHSEKLVRQALESSTHGRTSVIIAHRLDTIRYCDEICFVEEGRIVERGTHKELISKRGKYSEMIEQQRLS